jgi:MFS family permease
VYLQDSPKTASWLKPEERAHLASHLDEEQVRADTKKVIPLKALIRTPGTFLLCASSFLVGLFLTAILFWMPQIASSSGLTGTIAGTSNLVVIPYAISASAMYLWSWNSDRTGEFARHVAAALGVAAIFLLLLPAIHSPGAGFIILSSAMAACYAGYAPFFALVMENFTPGLRASGVALVNAIASCGSAAGPMVLGLAGGRIDSPGSALLEILLGAGIAACAILMVRDEIAAAFRQLFSKCSLRHS